MNLLLQLGRGVLGGAWPGTERFGAVAPAVDGNTVSGARELLAFHFTAYASERLAAGDGPGWQGVAQAVRAIRTSQVETADQVYGVAFDAAVLIEKNPEADHLTTLVDELRRKQLDVVPWSQVPPDDAELPMHWWARRVVLLLVAEGNPDQATHGQALFAVARELVTAPAWTSSKIATRPGVLTLYQWLWNQSALPQDATFTRDYLAREMAILNAHVTTPWDKARETLDKVDDAKDWFEENAGAIAGIGFGTVAIVGAALFAREIREGVSGVASVLHRDRRTS